MKQEATQLFRNGVFVVLLLGACGWLAPPASAQLRVVTYNTANVSVGPRSGMSTVLQAIGEWSAEGISRPIDVLLLQEQASAQTTTQQFVDILNSIYGAGTYARGNLNGAGGAGRQTIVYNTNTVELISEDGVGNAGGGNRQPRETLLYQLRPVGYESNADFWIFNSHYKAGDFDDGNNGTRRLVEAAAIRSRADSLGQGAHIIYTGDFNMDSSNEAAFQRLLNPGNGQAFDPIDQLGNWSNNFSFAQWHTQSPASTSAGGLVTGGIDDRFDLQLVTEEFLDGEGLDYIPGTYHTFGNNGSTFNDPVNQGNNVGLPSNVLNALATVSDHLPVVADYQLPAMMFASASSVPSRVIQGASVEVAASAQNIAPVATANGADELDFTVNGTGDWQGGGAGTADTLGPAVSLTLALDTSSPGQRGGDIEFTPTSPGVPGGVQTVGRSVTVLANAAPSFAVDSEDQSLEIDFGSFEVGDEGALEFGQLFAREVAPGLTAILENDGSTATGDTDAFSVLLPQFTQLLPGTSASWIAGFTPTEAGEFSATYELFYSDEDLPGATDHVLTLTLLASVSPGITLAADFDGDGDVDGDDLAIWQGNYGLASGANPSDGDADADGDVDGADLLVWQETFGESAGSLVGAGVPEPSTLVALLLALAVGAMRLSGRRG